MKPIERAEHWRLYPVAKAERIDALYKTSHVGFAVRDVMLRELANVAPAPSKVLDVGCGTGDVTIPLHDAGYSVTGLDISAAMLEVFRRNACDRQIELLVGNVMEMEAQPVFDAVVCRYVLSHYSAFGDFVSGMARFVRPGGWIIFDSFSREAADTAAELLGIEDAAERVYMNLASFSDEALQAFCTAAGMTLVRRVPAAFFHRNPLLAAPFTQIADYDAALTRHLESPDVRAFAAWIDSIVTCSKVSGSVVNVLQLPVHSRA